jgi:multidrug resistance efflux pump
VEQAERETDSCKAKLSTAEASVREQVDKHKHTKEELKQLKINYQQAKSQFAVY